MIFAVCCNLCVGLKSTRRGADICRNLEVEAIDLHLALRLYDSYPETSYGGNGDETSDKLPSRWSDGGGDLGRMPEGQRALGQQWIF